MQSARQSADGNARQLVQRTEERPANSAISLQIPGSGIQVPIIAVRLRDVWKRPPIPGAVPGTLISRLLSST